MARAEFLEEWSESIGRQGLDEYEFGRRSQLSCGGAGQVGQDCPSHARTAPHGGIQLQRTRLYICLVDCNRNVDAQFRK